MKNVVANRDPLGSSKEQKEERKKKIDCTQRNTNSLG